MTIIETVKNSPFLLKTFMRFLTDSVAGYIDTPLRINGEDVVITTPNNKKLQEQNIQNVQDAFGKMKQTIYVDSDTGSDSNDGLSLGTAFKTIKAAVDSYKSVRRVLDIRLYGSNAHIIDSHISAEYVNIEISGKSTENIVRQTGYTDGYGNAGYGFILIYSTIRFNNLLKL